MTLYSKSESFELLHSLRSLWNIGGQNISVNTEGYRKKLQEKLFVSYKMQSSIVYSYVADIIVLWANWGSNPSLFPRRRLAEPAALG